jgi:hypothetical protein
MNILSTDIYQLSTFSLNLLIFVEMNLLKRCFFLLMGMISLVTCFCQTDTPVRKTTTTQSSIKRNDSVSRPFSNPTKQVVVDTQLNGTSILVDSSGTALDSTVVDTLKAEMLPIGPFKDTSTYRKYYTHPYLPLSGKPMFMISDFRERRTLDDMFYLLMGVLLLVAFVRTAFPRYFKNLFILFFQTSLRQKQTKDQLLQDNLGSLFVNLLFIITTSIYGALVIRNKAWLDYPFWHIVFFGAALLTIVYLGKFIFLQFSGWVFNSREAAVNYTFTVFLVNKVLGVLLVPFLFLMAFAQPSLKEVALTVSVGLVALLLLYRYVISFATIRNTLKVNALHFLMYLCAVEILPLLLLYKLMADYIGGRF